MDPRWNCYFTVLFMCKSLQVWCEDQFRESSTAIYYKDGEEESFNNTIIVIQQGDRINHIFVRTYILIGVGLVFGAILFFCCLIACCPNLRRTVIKGHVLRPSSSAVHHQPSAPDIVVEPDTESELQEHPPSYDTVQRQLREQASKLSPLYRQHAEAHNPSERPITM